MSTAFGPQGPNYSLTRPPADPQASGGADTFFVNCSAAGAKDGTFATADFFNMHLANIRYLVRTAGIALNDADDQMVYKAILAMIDAELLKIVVQPQRPLALANQIYYVNSVSGSDANDGLTAGHAFATLQKALNVMSTFDNNGFDVSIIVANGTYASVLLPRQTGSGTCFIIGNITTPNLCVVTGAASCFDATNTNSTYDITGFRVVSTVGDGFVADGSGSNILIGCIDFGPCGGPGHIVSQRGGLVIMKGTNGQGAIPSPFITISGGCGNHMLSTQGGEIDVYSQPVTITTPVVFTGAFATASRLGMISAPGGPPYSSVTGATNVSGQRYSSSTNSVIETGGGGASYFPGTIAGTATTGGLYD